jgi:hypothetical protein
VILSNTSATSSLTVQSVSISAQLPPVARSTAFDRTPAEACCLPVESARSQSQSDRPVGRRPSR